MYKRFEQTGGNPELWLDLFLREIGMTRNERSAKEMYILCRAMRLGGEYDMLSGPTLACLKCLRRGCRSWLLLTVVVTSRTLTGGPRSTFFQRAQCSMWCRVLLSSLLTD